MANSKCRAKDHDYFYVQFSFGGYYECLNCYHRPSADEYYEWENN